MSTWRLLSNSLPYLRKQPEFRCFDLNHLMLCLISSSSINMYFRARANERTTNAVKGYWQRKFLLLISIKHSHGILNFWFSRVYRTSLLRKMVRKLNSCHFEQLPFWKKTDLLIYASIHSWRHKMGSSNFGYIDYIVLRRCNLNILLKFKK